MGGNPDSDEFEEDDAGRGRRRRRLDLRPRHQGHGDRQAPRVKVGEPAWRRLEQRLEQKRTAELISDFEDYDIGDPEPDGTSGSGHASAKSRRDCLGGGSHCRSAAA